jgi:serine/threonine protein kinase
MPGGEIEKQLCVSDTQKMIYLYGSARGFVYMDAKEVVDRDVKLSNILLDAQNYPSICDLGLAKFHDNPSVTNKMGTPEYMAPEIIEADRQEVTGLLFPSDVYSYAIMFWEVVVGRKWSMKPRYCSTMAFWNAVTQDDNPFRPPLDEVPLEVHRDVLRCIWQRQPDVRPTFREIAHQLEQRDFWLPGTEAEEFLKYVKYINAEEKRIAPDATNVFWDVLRQVPGGYELITLLNDTTIDRAEDTLTAKLICSRGIVCGSGATPNQEVMNAVSHSLKEHKSLNPTEINKSAAQAVNPIEVM